MSNTPPDHVHEDIPSLRADYARVRELRGELDRRASLSVNFNKFALITAVLPIVFALGIKNVVDKTANENIRNADGTFMAAFAAGARDYTAYTNLQKQLVPTTRDKACMDQNTVPGPAEKTPVLDGNAALQCLQNYDPVRDRVQVKDRIVRDPSTWFLGFLMLMSLYGLPGAYRRSKAEKQTTDALRTEYKILKTKVEKTLGGPV
jgi:hypothetical protein